MRIVTGQYKGKALKSPTGLDTRPTSIRVREAIFNILRHVSWATNFTGIKSDTIIMDLFCGTGALGLEALSNGANHCTFIDIEPQYCHDNIALLKLQSKSKLYNCRADNIPKRPHGLASAQLIFVDPPYRKNLAQAALTSLTKNDWLSNKAICVIESDKKHPEKLNDEFILLKEKKYGKTLIQFYEWNKL